MLNSKDRTMDEYIKAGAAMRLLKSVGSKALTDVSGILSAKDQDMFINCLNKLDLICCRAEDNMLKDYPGMGCEFSDVFYGEVNDTPRTDMDRKVISKAKEIADELFERKTD